MYNRVLFIAILIITSCNLFGQPLQDFTGKVYFEKKVEGVQGSPFLFEQWKPGKVILKNGSQFDKVQLKFDAEQNKFLYNQKDSLYEFIHPLAEVRLYDETGANDSIFSMVFKNNISAGAKLNPGQFVQVLCQGKVTLIKQYVKNIEGENKNSGYTTTVKQYVLYTNLWAIVNKEVIPIKLTGNFLEQLTGDKNSEVQNYVRANGLKIKSERGFVSAVAYYNLISK